MKDLNPKPVQIRDQPKCYILGTASKFKNGSSQIIKLAIFHLFFTAKVCKPSSANTKMPPDINTIL